MKRILAGLNVRTGNSPRRAILVSTLAAGVILIAAVALGNMGATSASTCGDASGNSGPSPLTSCVSMANNKYHAVRYAGLGNDWGIIDNRLTAAIDNDLNPTDMVAYVTTTDDYPDAWAYDGWYGTSSPYGWVDCPENNTGTGGSGTSRWCRGQIIRFNASHQNSSLIVGNEDVLACHELGHTVGLRHDDVHPDDWAHEGCMERYVNDFGGVGAHYSIHDEEHIDGNY